MHYKARPPTTTFSDKMAAAATPIAIGTQGTVGSLVRKEIEYFTRCELHRCESLRKAKTQGVDMPSNCTNNSKGGFWSLNISWRRKKRRASGGLLPRICSAVEVSDTNRLNEIPGFNYRILKNDFKDIMHI